ncbi:E3 ubiquitin-protein ligase znrf2-like [Dendronephthya gigantea]|uniref:E3 ubiquitin-protein ligase znrf2-like n=1 Tax=Dendronephthya gigantea TaxID=151771 RepID=UPI00106D4538|nr:E3 ubiquitin-protein ligase znrf2-like [Dendronephthya gigantea]
MGTKLSSPNNRRNHPSTVTAGEIQGRGGIDVSSRTRSRSLEIREHHSRSIPTRRLQTREISSEENSSGDNSTGVSNMLHSSSLPGQLFALHGLRCPVCSKFVQSDDVELHFVMCLTKPRLAYNADILSQDSGECVICLEDLLAGEKIARLPCLCIYHKKCIDKWFKKNRTCPEHPS